MKQYAILKDKGKGNHGGTNPIVKENILLLTEKRLSKYVNDAGFLTELDVPQTVEQLTVAGADETGDLQYYAYATNFPVLTKFYPATPKTINLSVGDADFGRVDLILANKPDTVGGMGYITKSEGTPSLGAQPNNIDLATQYIIKWIYVAPNATIGDDVTPKPSRTYLSEFINDGNGDIAKPFITVDDLSNNTIQSVVGGNNITIDNTDPLNPIISSIASTYPPPYIDVVIPDSTLPSTTGNFELHGSNFKEDMTVVFAGQTVNYKIYHSSLHVTVNVTTGATEGLFSITLDNGISRTFPNAYMVVLGTVYEPLSTDWINVTGGLDVSSGKDALIQSFNVATNADSVFVLDYTKDFSFRFKFKASPLGIIPLNNGSSGLVIKTLDGITEIFKANVEHHNATTNYLINGIVTGTIINNYPGNILNDISNNVIEFRWRGGFLTYYLNSVQKTSKAYSLTQNLKVKLNPNMIDIIDMKSIELA